MVGRTLGHYEIIEPLGAGGMGEVYRARDTTLQRDVAIKVLPEDLADDPERLARLEREATAVAALDHPNIVVIHSVEEVDADGGGRIHFITMQLVEGKTLSELIPRNGFALEKLFDLAVPLCDAISSAHEQGIIHRDLKPANIMVSDDGRVRVLDFGLAKLRDEGASAEERTEMPTAAQAEPLTDEGKILGTVAYMSPEQAEGKPIDHRTDIFSLGIMIYEMATGERPFKGDTNVSIMSSIVKDTPTSVTELNRGLPRHMGRIVKRALEKDLARRYHSAADLRNDLEELKEEIVSGDLEVGAHTRPAASSPLSQALPWALVALIAVVAGVVMWAPWRPQLAPPSVTRSSIVLPQGLVLPVEQSSWPVAISPDGTRLIYRACQRDDLDHCHLYMHDLETADHRQIGQGLNPFFSPDGRWLGFSGAGLSKLLLDGEGLPTPLITELPRTRGFTWAQDDTIVLPPDGNSGLMRISAAGGEFEPLTALDVDAGELSHRYPHALPGERGVIFNVWSGGYPADMDLQIYSFETGERRTLTKGLHARYVPSGHLLFARRPEGSPTPYTGRLYAASFDLDELQIDGPEVPVQDNVYLYGDGPGSAFYSVSDTGRLVYVPSPSPDRRIVLVDFEGNAEPLQAPPLYYFSVRVSPGGRHLALGNGAHPYALDLFEMEQGRRSPLLTSVTDEEGIEWAFDTHAGWSPDGKRVAFSAISPGSVPQMFVISVDGAANPERLDPSDKARSPHAWTPDGANLLYVAWDSEESSYDIWEIGLDDARSTRKLAGGPGTQSQPVVSPDMRWLAYTSNQTGQYEVWVRAYGAQGRPVQVSTGGGMAPTWSADGREVYFRNGDQMMATPVVTEPQLSAGTPRLLFEGSYVHTTGFLPREYDLSPDGDRFIMIQGGETPGTRIEFVENWFEELKRLVPTEQ